MSYARWFILLALAACTPQNKQSVQYHMNDTSQRMQHAVREEVREINRSIQNYITPEPKKPLRPIPVSSYCYRAYGDVVCYRDPVPGGEERLIGYQEPPAKPGALPPMKTETVSITPVRARNLSMPAPPPAAKDKETPLNPYAPVELIKKPNG